MNRFAYLTSKFAVKALSKLSKARIFIHDQQNIPEQGAIIFVINHFTRIETLLMPYYIYQLTDIPVWSLADYSLFKGGLSVYLDQVGAISTKNPDRDRIIVKSLMTGQANWIIFPEGRMVKDKKIFEKGNFIVSSPSGIHRPHTGAAALALRTEFYRQRLLYTSEKCTEEAKRLLSLFQIPSVEYLSKYPASIVPVNITYYPIRARENIINKLAVNLLEDVSDRMSEEIMIEGTMLLSGVDIDIRFGKPIQVSEFMNHHAIQKDILANCKINFDDPIPSIQIMRKIAMEIMQLYMEAIYNMTTVNHDHLFASLLKLMPFQDIDPEDLKRRVFLIAAYNLDKKGVYHHTSLDADQVHLLTDDRYHKFKEFLTIASEKEVVRSKENRLIKDLLKFRTGLDFHRVRVDNPIAVMANEVEPLSLLQRKIRRLAWLSESRIKRMVINHLLISASLEFEADYKRFYIDGESKGKDVGNPILLEGISRETGVLMVHGYMAAPLEVKGLADYLAQRGLWVYCPRLRGHGTSPDDLATRTYQDWIESVDRGYAIISNICKTVVVGGFSTGAALALDLAARMENLKGVFAVGPPLRLQYLGSAFAPAVDTWNRLMKRVYPGVVKEFVENKPENPHINYFRNPISGVKEIETLMDQLEPKLPDITIPALVLQSFRDPVVNYKGSRQIFELLGSKDKQHLLFNFERHGILLGHGANKVYESIWNFIKYI